MRRARIKALATVPVRRKVIQNTVASVDTSMPDKGHTQEDVSNTYIPEQEVIKDMIKVHEKTTEKEQNRPNLTKPKLVMVEKSNSQEPCTQVNNKSKEDSNETVQKNVLLSETSSIVDITTAQKRRMLVSESARKLAEARREFLIKHGNKTPDRSQLKMYDLIYYNPVTNPMKKPKTPTVVPRQITIPQPMELPEEEDEDDPSAMPAPQVKVGPDGQLIIDEKSLVIEQTSAKKNREILAQEAIVDDDNHGGGFYKKRQKSKEWPKWETFKFYRALNVVGTDFLLMQSLFPNRTRQQIKQKYKKEERVNRHLIEKALKYHQEFNTEMLEEQLGMLQQLENIQSNTEKKSLEKDKSKEGQGQTKNAIKRRRRLVASSIGECETLSVNDKPENALAIGDETDVDINCETSSSQHQQGRKENKRKLKRRLDDSFDKSDSSSFVNSSSNSDSDTEVYQIRPTRSGRLSKVTKKLQGPDFSTLDNYPENELLINCETAISSERDTEVIEMQKMQKNSCASLKTSEDVETTSSENITTVIPDINKIEPGSLVILSKESTEEPGNTILQVYMVSSNVDNTNMVKSSMTPVDLSSKLSSKVTSEIEDTELINVVDDCE